METTPDFVLFLGRFHPLAVHLPIGFLVLAFVMELFSRRPKYESLKGATSFVLLLSVMGALLSVVLGLFLARGGGYDEELLSTHKAQGIWLTIITLLAWLIKAQPKWLKIGMPPVVKKAYLPLLVVATGLMAFTGHNGGSLTHGSEYLFQYAPNGIRAIAGLPPKKEARPPITDINQAMVFDDLIHPMLEDRCVSCHRAGKKKGKLRMDTREELLKGGDEGPVFVAGNAEESNIFIRVTLPEEDEEHMPPEGKRPLTEKQIQLLEWWINAGAPMDKTVAEMEVPEEIAPLLAAYGEGGLDADPNAPQGIFATSVEAASPDAISDLVREGVLVMPISQGTNFLRVTVNQDTTPFGDSEMKLLRPLAEQITWLDLRYATPDDYSVLKELTNLTELHLEKSPIEDEDLENLAGLSKLEYLNLYGTEVSNEGVKHLTGLTNLRSLYLWQSKVDSTGWQELTTAIPGVEVNLGWPMQSAK
jgi:uncharacterized membrane protein